jgi:hypothetical protein
MIGWLLHGSTDLGSVHLDHKRLTDAEAFTERQKDGAVGPVTIVTAAELARDRFWHKVGARAKVVPMMRKA